MLDFLKTVRWKFINILIETVIRVIYGNSYDFLVSRAAIFHNQNTDGNTFDYSHRADYFAAKNQNIKRVPVRRVGARNESVIGGIVSRSKQDTVEFEHTGLFIKLIFIFTAL